MLKNDRGSWELGHLFLKHYNHPAGHVTLTNRGYPKYK